MTVTRNAVTNVLLGVFSTLILLMVFGSGNNVIAQTIQSVTFGDVVARNIKASNVEVTGSVTVKSKGGGRIVLTAVGSDPYIFLEKKNVDKMYTAAVYMSDAQGFVVGGNLQATRDKNGNFVHGPDGYRFAVSQNLKSDEVSLQVYKGDKRYSIELDPARIEALLTEPTQD